MNPSPWLSRCLPVAAIAALSVVALLTVTVGERFPHRQVATQRPAADAPVHVVRAPARATPGKEPCRTCELGAGGSTL
jgi:hypothetical protein